MRVVVSEFVNEKTSELVVDISKAFLKRKENSYRLYLLNDHHTSDDSYYLITEKEYKRLKKMILALNKNQKEVEPVFEREDVEGSIAELEV